MANKSKNKSIYTWQKEVVEKAMIHLKKGWCKEVSARDKKGEIVAYNSRRAATFSLPGAINRAEWELMPPLAVTGKTLRYLDDMTGGLVRFNEQAQSVAEIFTLCGNAITSLEKSEKAFFSAKKAGQGDESD